jgi:hypothetical protein
MVNHETVLLVVPHSPPILPALLLAHPQAHIGYFGCNLLGPRTGKVSIFPL